jgi:hypothetical protein
LSAGQPSPIKATTRFREGRNRLNAFPIEVRHVACTASKR